MSISKLHSSFLLLSLIIMVMGLSACADDGQEDAKSVDFVPFTKAAYQCPKPPMLSIVIDDLGAHHNTASFTQMDHMLTLSFLPYAPRLESHVKSARDKGHETMMHMPMQPLTMNKPEPLMIRDFMDDYLTMEVLTQSFDRFGDLQPHAINNHMGSKITESEDHMDAVMKALKERDGFFLDSKTTAETKAKLSAEKYGVPYLVRHVFIDHDGDDLSPLERLKQADQRAMEKGYAIAIGHPHNTTLEALKTFSSERKAYPATLSDILEHKKCAVRG